MVRKVPKWFRERVAVERGRIYTNADRDAAVKRLTDETLADPAFTRAILAEHVRTAIKDLERQHWRSPDERVRHMETAARLRADGKSLRQIAATLHVSEGTVRGDLKRWERDRANVAPLRRDETPPRGGVWSARDGGRLLEDRTVRKSGAQIHPEPTQQTYADADVVPIRRPS